MSDSYEENSQHLSDCKDCESVPHHPHVSIGKIVAKVPVVLSELSLQLDLDTMIKFPEPVLEIKDVKKRVKLTQCRLLLPTNRLFIKGFVRKNIQYASPSKDIEQNTKSSIASDLHSYTVDVPFQCVTEVKKFLSKPVMPQVNSREEFDFFVAQPLPSGYPEKDELLTSDLSQFHQESTQFYNELPFCELISSKIIEWDEAVDRVSLHKDAPVGEGYFTKVEEKMVIDLKVRLLQNQQARVSSSTNDCCNNHDIEEE
ncbi:CsxC family protein [Radiobacillus sp. PE A8.2]|uniref:CsxC family protein n=1 Tax=Radiobacillus sp. PE A8.2 TaxID=3380349 RepID=UPI00388D548F